jgi:hypothetical protein
MARRKITILDAVRDPMIFGPCFKDHATWASWRAFLAALFGLPLDAGALETFRACTGRSTTPTSPSREAWLICGRRAGKSFTLALIAVFLACFKDYRKHLASGERATIMVVASDRKQARTILRYISGLLNDNPMLARLVQSNRSDAFDLFNRVTIEVGTCSIRALRGYTIAAALLDEVAFWRDENSSDPDVEVISSIRPGMLTIPGAMLLCASSPYAKRGALWDTYRRHWSKDHAPVLVWKATTRQMNPSVPQADIDNAMDADPARATAEYLAEFRTDVETFLSREAVEGCISPGVSARAPLSSTQYAGFVDPSGGASDSMTLAICHAEYPTSRDKRVIVLDAIQERKPPFSPEQVVDEFAALLKQYRIHSITGDRYAGEWPREQFKKRGIQYIPAAKPKSEIYLELLPHVSSRSLDLLDHQKLVNQLISLERRTARGGKDSIDHAPGAHDDIANAVAGAIYLAASRAAIPIVAGEVISIPRTMQFENNEHSDYSWYMRQ